MVTMLCEYYSSIFPEYKVWFTSYFEQNNCKIIGDSQGIGAITTSIQLAYNDKYSFVISEFPGNCSSIILHGIQSKIFGDIVDHCINSDIWKSIINIGIDLCKKLNYGALFISLSNEKCRDEVIKEFPFKCVTEFKNPHSFKVNYFLQLLMNKEEQVK